MNRGSCSYDTRSSVLKHTQDQFGQVLSNMDSEHGTDDWEHRPGEETVKKKAGSTSEGILNWDRNLDNID
ncbi:hypothetical protein WMY93_012176 [Mugilogobius chulae]|uniref:Uncharacterized protein n=1 Tax=Mugilogobius chulae TaxID=88201 RepID=A0AAW0P4R0_9GOBI